MASSLELLKDLLRKSNKCRIVIPFSIISHMLQEIGLTDGFYPYFILALASSLRKEGFHVSIRDNELIVRLSR